MTINIQTENLLLALLPVAITIFFLWKWGLDHRNSIYAVFRMLIQLFLIGYVLTYIFEANSSWIVILTLSVMLVSSSIISLRTMKVPKKKLYLKSFIAITAGGVLTLVVVTQGVINIEPWFKPTYMIPLAGMIFANAMNSISLAGERLVAEMNRGNSYETSRPIALQASLIPIINSLFAVGLVSLPGMMTGQILSEVSPFIAAKYQIVVMCMVFGAAGISSVIFLSLMKSALHSENVG